MKSLKHMKSLRHMKSRNLAFLVARPVARHGYWVDNCRSVRGCFYVQIKAKGANLAVSLTDLPRLTLAPLGGGGAKGPLWFFANSS